MFLYTVEMKVYVSHYSDSFCDAKKSQINFFTWNVKVQPTVFRMNEFKVLIFSLPKLHLGFVTRLLK